MRSEMIRTFIRMGRASEAMFTGDEIALVPCEYEGRNRQIGCECTFKFYLRHKTSGGIAGHISLRVGDSPEQFYLGHIGYHVRPLFRGHGYAADACRLLVPVLAAFGMRSVVITTDPTNIPSIRTCERLHCCLESTVAVPVEVREKVDISSVKRRYIWMPIKP